MKRKFVKVMFFGALALSTVTYVGCKDYDDDIDNLQTQIDANKANIAELQKFVDEGNWVTKVEDITDGFRITFNNGKTYEIVDGEDGTPGVPGTSSTVTISETGEWLINGEPTGWSARAPYIQEGYWYYWSKSANGGKGGFVKGDKATGEAGTPGTPGTPGTDGFSPYIADGTNGDKGYWYFYEPDNQNAITSGDLKGWVKGPFTETTISLTKSADKPCWILKQTLGEGNTKTVILPTADNLISLKGVSIIGGKIETAGTKEVTLYYGVVNDANGVKFGDPEVTYAKGTLLTSNSAIINTMVNPSDIDLAQYSIKLQDSHGNTCYTLSQPKENMSSTPLTRANEQWNKGIYDLTISFAEGINADKIKDGVAYALATENAWGKTILSEYDVKVKPDNTTVPTLSASYSIDVPFNEEKELDELVKSAGESNIENVAAYYYEFSNLPTTVTFDKTKNTIESTIGQTITGTLHYLKVDGTKGRTALTLNFKSVAPEVILSEMNWTINTPMADAKVTLPAEIKNLLDDASGNYSLIYAGGTDLTTPGNGDIAFAQTPVKVDGNVVNYQDGSISLALTNNGQTGEKKVYYLTPNFQNAKVTATSHIVKLVVKDRSGSTLLGTDVVRKINLKVNIIQDNSKIFVFKPLTAFFDESKTNATGYGVPTTTDVEYNLYTLFETISDQANISFVTGTWTVASGKVTIPYADISKGTTVKKHDLTIAYQPFANTNLAKIKYPFTLAVWSEIERGTHGTVTGKFLSEAQRTEKLELAKFIWKDVKGDAITLASDARIKSIALELSDEAKNYMTLDYIDFKAHTTINVTMKDNITHVATEIPGSKSYVTVKVVDTWGVTTSVKVEIPIKKL